MTDLANIRAQIIGQPLLVEPGYARAMIGAVADRIDIDALNADGTRLDRAALKAAAQAQRPRGASRKIHEQYGNVAVIRVAGTLVHKFGYLEPVSGMTGYDAIQLKLETALADESVKGVLFDIDSPGGQVSGAFDLADMIAAANKPTWAVIDETAASAAYALAAATDRVVLPRTARLGSIGVVLLHEDKSKQLEQQGRAITLITAGAHKADGNPFQPLPDSVRTDLQNEINLTYDLFVSSVARYRGLSEQAVRDTEAGLFTGQHAVDAGLADEVMPAHDVLAAFQRELKGGSASTRQRRRATRKRTHSPTLAALAADCYSADQAGEQLPRRKLNAAEFYD